MNLILEPVRLLTAGAIATAWTVWTLHVLRRARKARDAREAGAHISGSTDPARAKAPAAKAGAPASPILVAVASQTGVAAELASRTAERLRAAGVAVRVESLGRLDESALRRAGRALFVASTCGEGDAPDEAYGFVRRMSAPGPGLDGFGFAVLALGDRSYANFCAFGRRLESWLLGRGAAPLWERIDVDGADTAALQRWDEALIALAGADTAVRAVARSSAFAGMDASVEDSDADVDSVAFGSLGVSPCAGSQAANIDDSSADGTTFSRWRLVSREPMNPGSVGEPILRLIFEPAQDDEEPATTGKAAAIGKATRTGKATTTSDATTTGRATPSPSSIWQPGDLAQLRIPDGQSSALRDYSIASLPGDRRIELFVRLQRHDDGRLGLASGWLSGAGATERQTRATERQSAATGLQPGGTVELRLRANVSFRLAGARDSPLILVGSGSGLAGLRALLRAREIERAGPNWLIFGERNEAHDFLCRDEIEAWCSTGVLERFDAVFSRDGGERRYVQHRLVERADTLRRWIAAGAAIHVCGSRERLAVGVDGALTRILGEEGFARLRESGRYRRDVW